MSKLSNSDQREFFLIEAYDKLNQAIIIMNDLVAKAQFDENDNADKLYDDAIDLTDQSIELMNQYELLIDETDKPAETSLTGEEG